MRCPYCGSMDDRVVDSRTADEGTAIRRRRECAGCTRRFTTFERAERVSLQIIKRSGVRVPFDRARVVEGIARACKNRPVSPEEIERLAREVEQELLASGVGAVPSSEVGVAVLDRLRELDEVSYVRFASVYKEFQEATDFEREVGMLLEKSTPPKNAVTADR